MLFMVPDPAEEADKAKAAAQADAMIDTSETSRGAQKVELDLEDAPFLEEEEEVKPEPAKPRVETSLEAPKEEKPASKLGRKQLMIIGAAALLVLVAAALAVKFLFFKGKPAPPPAKVEQSAPSNATAPDAEAKAPELPETQVRLEPFWVEQRSGEEIRFLIVRILLGTSDKAIAREFEAKIMPARNAIFYYLKNKDVQFLTDENNAEKLKHELLLVINQYVTDGKFETLLFEEYVVK